MTRIVRIEWARLEGERPRVAGCNARLGEHGRRVAPPIARVTTDEGATGFGWSQVSQAQASEWIGLELDEMMALPEGGVRAPFIALEYPLWDLAGQMAGRPVYEMLGEEEVVGASLYVACYDTSLYMDDLHLADDDAAAELIAREALEGAARGHRLRGLGLRGLSGAGGAV